MSLFICNGIDWVLVTDTPVAVIDSAIHGNHPASLWFDSRVLSQLLILDVKLVRITQPVCSFMLHRHAM